jgi:hypothetical protein
MGLSDIVNRAANYRRKLSNFISKAGLDGFLSRKKQIVLIEIRPLFRREPDVVSKDTGVTPEERDQFMAEPAPGNKLLEFKMILEIR